MNPKKLALQSILLSLVLFGLFSFALTSTLAAQSSISDRLTLQGSLDKHVFLNEASFPWAHNAFNSSAYDYFFEVNQDTTLTQQLDGGLRFIDLDMEWFLNFGEVYLCHNGCSRGVSSLRSHLDEIYDWFHPLDQTLRQYRLDNEVVILYLEAGNVEMFGRFDKAISDFKNAGLEDLIYKPSSGNCEAFSSMANSTTKGTVLAEGKNIILVGADSTTCEEDGWKNWTYKTPDNNRIYHEAVYPKVLKQFDGYPTCINKYEEWWSTTTIDMASTSKFTFAYNDIWAFSPLDEMSQSQIETMVGCGVNAISREYYDPDSSTHEALIWSWRTNEPNAGSTSISSCAWHTSSGLIDGSCTAGVRYGCQNMNTGNWKVTTGYGPWAGGAQKCYQEYGLDYAFSVPANGYQFNRLQDAKASSTHTVSLNYTDKDEHGNWQAMSQFNEARFLFENGNPNGELHRTTRIPMITDATSTGNRYGMLNSSFHFSHANDSAMGGVWEQEFGENVTFSLWFRANSAATLDNWPRLVEFSKDGSYHTSTAVAFDTDGSLRAWCENSDGTRKGLIDPTTDLRDNSWHHVAYVNDGTKAKLYLDGSKIGEVDGCSNIMDSKVLTIGSRYGMSNNSFEGSIDDVRIFGVALSESDIQALATY